MKDPFSAGYSLPNMMSSCLTALNVIISLFTNLLYVTQIKIYSATLFLRHSLVLHRFQALAELIKCCVFICIAQRNITHDLASSTFYLSLWSERSAIYKKEHKTSVYFNYSVKTSHLTQKVYAEIIEWHN